MLATYGAVALLYAASIVVGEAILRASGHPPWRGFGPATGLAALLVVCSVTIELPGRGTTAVVAAALALALAGFRLRKGPWPQPSPWLALATLRVALMLSVPFVANARIGLLGVSYFNDLSVHLPWTVNLLWGDGIGTYGPSAGYPLGPHSLVGNVATLTGGQLDLTFDGLLIAVQLLAVPAAWALLDGLPAPTRGVGSLCVAVPYMTVAYYVQGGFKETIMATFTLAFAAALREAVRGRRFAARMAIPFAVICAGVLYNFSYSGLAWPLGTLVLWLALELISGRVRLRNLLSTRAGGLRWAAAAGVVLALLVVPDIPRILDFVNQLGASPAGGGVIPGTAMGNLPKPLSALEGLGIWLSQDYRFPPDAFDKGLFTPLAIGVAAYGAIWWLRRRDFVLPAATAAAALIFVYLRTAESPYLDAKALGIGAPLVVALGVRALFDPWPSLFRVPEAALARAGIAAVFVAVVLLSSLAALRGSQVGPRAHLHELEQLRSLMKGRQEVHLVPDDYVLYELRGVGVTIAQGTGQAISSPQFVVRRDKHRGYGDPLDFDAVAPRQLDTFDFAITSNTRYQSGPPRNFRLVRRTPSFLLWRRQGRTPPRSTLFEEAAPGKVLDCRSAAGRRLSRRSGWASVWPRPIRTTVRNGSAGVRPGFSAGASVQLPPGRWELSVQYTSPQRVTVTGVGRAAVLPANLDRPGPYWRIGTVRSEAAVRRPIIFRVQNPTHLRPKQQVAFFYQLAAVRVDRGPTLVPLRRACDRYVDWYTFGARRPST